MRFSGSCNLCKSEKARSENSYGTHEPYKIRGQYSVQKCWKEDIFSEIIHSDNHNITIDQELQNLKHYRRM